MKIPAIRGAILEEIVLHLLELIGYRLVKVGEEGTHRGHSGLEVQGRGERHQIDALAAYDHTPAFMYPLRLMVEAKCNARGNPVKIDVVRNTVGVIKDISENYFTYRDDDDDLNEVQVPRFNYHAAIFSTSGYSSGAQKYALAHQIFLIQYQRIGILEPIVNALLELGDEHINLSASRGTQRNINRMLREEFRALLAGRVDVTADSGVVFNAAGLQRLRDNIVIPLKSIEGSYFGMLQGKWPMHLLSRNSLPAGMFTDSDVVQCKVYGRESDRWSFSPVDAKEGERNWFRLEFDIPEAIAKIVEKARRDAFELAQIKQEQFSFLDLAGQIGGIQRQVRLRLDEEWLQAYLQRIGGR